MASVTVDETGITLADLGDLSRPTAVETGPIGNRPASPDGPMFWVDEGPPASLSVWDGSSWTDIQGGGGPGEGSPTKFTRDWARDGLDGLYGVQYWSTGGDSVGSLVGGAHTPTINGDSLRIGSVSGNTNGNVREAWLVSDEDFDDFEVLVRIDRPSNIGVTFTPQPGLMLRAEGVGEPSGKAIAMFVNVFASYGPLNVYSQRPWAEQGDGSIIDAGATSSGTVAMPDITFPVRAAAVDSGNITAVLDSGSLNSAGAQAALNGQQVDYVSGSVLTNGITGVSNKTALAFGAVMVDSGGQSNKPMGATFGPYIRYHDISTSNGTPKQPGALFPAWLKVRVVGNQLKSKWWHTLQQNEPANWMNTITLAPDAPLSGKIGLVSNHLWGDSNYIAYGPVEITRLTTGIPS